MRTGPVTRSGAYVLGGSGESGPGVVVPSRLCTGKVNWVLSTEGNCNTNTVQLVSTASV